MPTLTDSDRFNLPWTVDAEPATGIYGKHDPTTAHVVASTAGGDSAFLVLFNADDEQSEAEARAKAEFICHRVNFAA